MTALHVPRDRLRVGYVLKRFPRLSETFILNEILELERQGAQVHVFSLRRPPDEARHGMLDALRARVTYLPRTDATDNWKVQVGLRSCDATKAPVWMAHDRTDRLFGGLLAGMDPQQAAHLSLQAMTIAMLASVEKIHHLHAHFASNATTAALLASRLSGIPYSFTAHARDIYHTYVNPDVDDAVRRRKIEEARFVVTVSEFNRAHLRSIAGEAATRKIHRLYNGIDLERFSQGAANAREPGLFLAVGRLVEKKGLRFLVDACRLLRQRGVNFRCVLVGQGEQRERLEAQIKTHGLEDIVNCIGAVPQESLVALMRSAMAVVLPCVVTQSGDRDALPTVLLEALAMGLPAISTPVSGVPEIIEHGHTGLLVPSADSNSLADAMARVAEDAALREALGRQGRRHALARFDLSKNVHVLHRFFQQSMPECQQRVEPRSDHGEGHADRVSVLG